MRKITPIPLNAGTGIQSRVKLLESEFMKNIYKQFIGAFRYKVMNSPIYSIQREVFEEIESLKS